MTVNPLIGDLGFISRHGRRPTRDDDEAERVACHVGFAERVLRASPVSHLRATQRAARSELLDVLADYVVARRFPRPVAHPGRLPVFVDEVGTRCAVGALVEHAVGTRAVLDIDAQHHTASVAEMAKHAHPALGVLAAQAGLSAAELALIQPTYGHEPPPPPAIQWQASIEGEVSVDHASTEYALTRSLAAVDLRWQPPHNDWLGEVTVALDAGAGIDSDEHAPYFASARAGTQIEWYPLCVLYSMGILASCSENSHRTGFLAGVMLDGEGPRLPLSWSVPVDAYWYLPAYFGHAHLGVTGGVKLQFAGADRPLGWNAGVSIAMPRAFTAKGGLAPRGLTAGIGVERVADLTFIAVTLALTSSDRDAGAYGSW